MKNDLQWVLQNSFDSHIIQSMEKQKTMAGARIDRDLWLRFAAAAKRQDKSVADLLEEALRAALGKKAAA